MARYNDIRALAESHATEISRSVQAWTGYLDTAAALYRGRAGGHIYQNFSVRMRLPAWSWRPGTTAWAAG